MKATEIEGGKGQWWREFGMGNESGGKEKAFEAQLLDMQILKVTDGRERILKISRGGWRIYSTSPKHTHAPLRGLSRG